MAITNASCVALTIPEHNKASVLSPSLDIHDNIEWVLQCKFNQILNSVVGDRIKSRISRWREVSVDRDMSPDIRTNKPRICLRNKDEASLAGTGDIQRRNRWYRRMTVARDGPWRPDKEVWVYAEPQEVLDQEVEEWHTVQIETDLGQSASVKSGEWIHEKML